MHLKLGTALAATTLLLSACSYVPSVGDRGVKKDALPVAVVEKPAEKPVATAVPLQESVSEPSELNAQSADGLAESAKSSGTENKQQEQSSAPVTEQLVVDSMEAEQTASQPVVSTDPNTFLVTSGNKDESHPFYGVGHAVGLAINGVQGQELVLVRGETYIFKVDTGVRHDFYLSTSQRGWGAATMTNGVKGNFTYKGIVRFQPGKDTPDMLYYQCRNHKNMGSMIHVINKGQEASVKLGQAPAALGGGKKKAAKPSAFVSGSPVKQKIRFAEMFINRSPITKRVEAGSNARAKSLLSEAREKLKIAQKAIDKGSDDAAMALVDGALQAMTEAGKLVPNQALMHEQKVKYAEKIHGIDTFKDSYRRNYKMMVKKKGKANVDQLDMAALDAKMAKASTLAGSDNFVEANRVLQEVQRTLTAALIRLLDDEVMSYELTFETKKEEFDYELSRYTSFAELVPIAIEQKHPPKQTVALMQRFVDKGEEIHKLALIEGKRKNYSEGIQMLQGATSHMQRALRIAGVR